MLISNPNLTHIILVLQSKANILLARHAVNTLHSYPSLFYDGRTLFDEPRYSVCLHHLLQRRPEVSLLLQFLGRGATGGKEPWGSRGVRGQGGMEAWGSRRVRGHRGVGVKESEGGTEVWGSGGVRGVQRCGGQGE